MMRLLTITALIVGIIGGSKGVSSFTLSNPATPIPQARGVVGASYGIAGVSIGKDSVPMLLNRIHLRFAVAPSSLLTLGVEAGATQVEVGGDTLGVGDTLAAFHGKYGLSGGVNATIATPFYFNDVMSIGAHASGNYFMSANKYNAQYGGIDIAAALGPQFHIKHFGYIGFGPRLYLISGQNYDTGGVAGKGYSNSNNLSGWLSIDFFPQSATAKPNGKPYISLEVSVTPSSRFSDKIPLREIAISVSIGTITKRLFGEETDVEWNP